MTDGKTPDEWAADFAQHRSAYEQFALRLEVLLRDLLHANGVDVIQVESRAKSVASFREKISRKDRAAADPFLSVTDLVGVRVITYYLDDVSSVGEILRKEFRIDEANTVDKVDTLLSDQFGYRSAHYVLGLTAARADLIEWAPYASLVAEVQVRTSLQHAWAAVSHKVEYKAADEAPPGLRRRLVRLSALFELADEQFEAIRDERAATLSAYSEEVTHGVFDLPVDTSSLPVYWSTSKKTAPFQEQARKFGVDFVDEQLDEARLTRDRADLVRVLRECGMTNLADLDRYLSDPRIAIVLQALASDAEESGDRTLLSASLDDVLTIILIIDKDRVDSLGPLVYGGDVPGKLAAVRQRAVTLGLPESEG